MSAFSYIDISSVDPAEKRVSGAVTIAPSEAPSRARQLVESGDVLVSTVRPNLNAVAIVPDELDGATASTGLAVLRPVSDELDTRYLYHWVRTPAFVRAMCQRATGASYPAVTERVVRDSKLPLPSLAEQRRIAALLDKADAIRRKRRESIKLLDEFLRSAFLEMFGDPVKNEKGWRVVKLQDVLTKPLRNGLSPADGGTVEGDVLTLTAITGSGFEPSEVKAARFAHAPAPDQVASSMDFLICRGNGNRKLMGRGRFPRAIARSTVFPDTMIAARVDATRVEPCFLEAVWETAVVRRALESSARTTSGIHKINQTVLLSTAFPLPPMAVQERFARLADHVMRLRERFSDGVGDALFDSLAQRSFGGEL